MANVQDNHAVSVLLLAGDADGVSAGTVGVEHGRVVCTHDPKGRHISIRGCNSRLRRTERDDVQSVLVDVCQVLLESSAFVNIAVEKRFT